MQSEPGHIPGAHTGQQRGRADSREVAEGEGPAAPRHSHSKDQVAFPPTKRDAKRAGHAAGAIAPSSRAGAPTGMGCGLQKTWSPLFQSRSGNKDRQALPPAEKRCEASKPCLRSHNALQQRRRTNRRRADCKRPGARSFNPAAAARIGWLPRLPEAMRSEQAMPPEPQPPLVKGARRQARGCGGQRARGPLFCTASAVRNNGAFPARQAGKAAEPACKPGSVVDSHSSRRHVTVTLEQPTRTRRGPRH